MIGAPGSLAYLPDCLAPPRGRPSAGVRTLYERSRGYEG
jgi:hypothetical protein